MKFYMKTTVNKIIVSARNQFKFTEHLDRIVEIIQPNERVGRKSE